MQTEITREFEFCAGHRLVGHGGKCEDLHGHNYVAEVTVSGPLDAVGRVIDFAELKNLVGHWIDGHWDHNMILREDDPCLSAVNPFCKSGQAYTMHTNPTAENMARELMEQLNKIFLTTDLECERIRLYETRGNYAEVTGK